MQAPEEAPSWGRLIDEARDALRPKVSQNEAARRAGITGTHWRQIVKGQAGAMASQRGIERLARMAQVAGVTPLQLEEVERADVARELRILRGDSAEEDAGADAYAAREGEDPFEHLDRLYEEWKRNPEDPVDLVQEILNAWRDRKSS